MKQDKPRTNAFAQGFSDAISGRPWRRAHYQLTSRQRLEYEQGAAAAVMQVGLDTVGWGKPGRKAAQRH